MANSRPVVATAVGGVTDLLGEARSSTEPGTSYTICERGLLVKSGDPEEFARGLACLVEDESLRAELGARGRDFVLQNHGKERLIADIRQLYDQLLARSQATSEGESARSQSSDEN